MQVDFSRNYFELFGLDANAEVPVSTLTARYRELQSHLHPDRFAAASDAERRWSLQAASFVNEGYRTLRDPLRRAGYLLTLQGIDLNVETDTRMAPEFLMEQLELREALEHIDRANEPHRELAALDRSLRERVSDTAAGFAAAVVASDWNGARECVRQWQFLDKLGQEVRDIEARLPDSDQYMTDTAEHG